MRGLGFGLLKDLLIIHLKCVTQLIDFVSENWNLLKLVIT